MKTTFVKAPGLLVSAAGASLPIRRVIDARSLLHDAKSRANGAGTGAAAERGVRRAPGEEGKWRRAEQLGCGRRLVAEGLMSLFGCFWMVFGVCKGVISYASP